MLETLAELIPGLIIIFALAVLQLGIVIAVVKLTEARWPRVVVITLGFMLLAYVVVYSLQSEGRASAGARWFERAALVARLYELDTQFDASDKAVQAKLRPELLKISSRVIGFYIPSCPGMPPQFVQRLEKIDSRPYGYGSENCDTGLSNARLVANMVILEQDKNPEHRLSALYGIGWDSDSGLRGELYSTIIDPKRFQSFIQRLVYQRNKGRAISASDRIGFDKLAAYTLANWHASRGQYDAAFEQLRLALGEDWVFTGRTNPWWDSHFPLGSEDHLMLGRILEMKGFRSQALREFRLARGQATRLEDMLRAYRGLAQTPRVEFH